MSLPTSKDSPVSPYTLKPKTELLSTRALTSGFQPHWFLRSSVPGSLLPEGLCLYCPLLGAFFSSPVNNYLTALSSSTTSFRKPSLIWGVSSSRPLRARGNMYPQNLEDHDPESSRYYLLHVYKCPETPGRNIAT